MLLIVTEMSNYKNNLKNMLGWRTSRKFVAFAVDDYGSVRLHSGKAHDKLLKSGIRLTSRFDNLDALETRQDIEALFETLESVRDSAGKSAVFTPYVITSNPDFDRIQADFNGYISKSLSDTLDELGSEMPNQYAGVKAIWSEGIARNLVKPQFHGREHFHLGIFRAKLKDRDSVFLKSLKHRSLVGIGGHKNFPGVSFTQAFGLASRDELKEHRAIIRDGLNAFNKKYEFCSSTFTPPAAQIHPALYKFLSECGIQGINTGLIRRYQDGGGRSRFEANIPWAMSAASMLNIIRNVVFEPSMQSTDESVRRAIDQIRNAFMWRKPAIISSHRVNFSGHINEENRKQGIKSLKLLLSSIKINWPDVEFISVDDLATKVGKIKSSKAHAC